MLRGGSMLQMVIAKAKTKKNIWMMVGLFIFFTGLYIFLDFEGNENYTIMAENFGLGIVLIHVLINIMIGILSSIMVGFSIINYNITKKKYFYVITLFLE